MNRKEARKEKKKDGEKEAEEVVYVPQKKWSIKKILIASSVIVIIVFLAGLLLWHLGVLGEEKVPVTIRVAEDMNWEEPLFKIDFIFSSPAKTGVNCEVKNSQDDKIEGGITYPKGQPNQEGKVDGFSWWPKNPLKAGQYQIKVSKRGVEDSKFSRFEVYPKKVEEANKVIPQIKKEATKPKEENEVVTPEKVVPTKSEAKSGGVNPSDYDQPL